MNDTESKNSYGHVLKYTGIFGGVQGLNILIGLVRNKLVALILGPAGMGLASLFNSLANFVSQATGLGISFGAVRHLSEIFDGGDNERILSFVKTVRAWSFMAALLGVAACVAAAPLLNMMAFDGDDRSLEIMALAPAVAMTALAGGETAILKGARRLRQLAEIQVLMVVVSLALSVPVYCFMGFSGIIPVIVLLAAANLIVTLRFSLKAYPLQTAGAAAALKDGSGMIRLGMAFVMSGVFGSGAEMAVRSFLNTCADLDTVGLYNAGYMITVTYAGMVFSAMESDYFPRLSAVNHDTAAVNLTVNRQIEVSLLVIAPMLAFVITALPLLIPLLFSGKFAPVVPMAQVAILSMYARATMLPVAYITLAKGHSRAYLVIEGISAAALVALMAACFSRWGLVGAGVAVLLSNVLDLAVILVYARLRYGFRLSRQVLTYAAAHVPIGIAAYAATFAHEAWLGITLGLLATAASTALTARTLYKKTEIWNKIKTKLKNKKNGM